jgi:hypothetical protein
MLDLPASRRQNLNLTGNLLDALVRAGGVLLLALLVMAYATGEEFQHTHMLLAWSGAAVVVTALYWELVRPHTARFADQLFGRRFIQATRIGLKGGHLEGSSGPVLIGITLLTLMAITGFAAVVLLALTHALWPAADVDEMHEVLAYLALGLVIFYIAIVLITSSEHIEARLSRPR